METISIGEHNGSKVYSTEGTDILVGLEPISSNVKVTDAQLESLVNSTKDKNQALLEQLVQDKITTTKTATQSLADSSTGLHGACDRC